MNASILPMSTCPHCGAPAGKFHTCKIGLKKERDADASIPKPKPLGTVRALMPTHDQRGRQLTADVVKAVSAKALEQSPKALPKRTPDPAVAAVAEQIAQKKAAKAAKQASREGKRPAMAWLDPPTAKLLKMAAAKHEVTQEQIIAEGVAYMLGDKYKP